MKSVKNVLCSLETKVKKFFYLENLVCTTIIARGLIGRDYRWTFEHDLVKGLKEIICTTAPYPCTDDNTFTMKLFAKKLNHHRIKIGDTGSSCTTSSKLDTTPQGLILQWTISCLPDKRMNAQEFAQFLRSFTNELTENIGLGCSITTIMSHNTYTNIFGKRYFKDSIIFQSPKDQSP